MAAKSTLMVIGLGVALGACDEPRRPPPEPTDRKEAQLLGLGTQPKERPAWVDTPVPAGRQGAPASGSWTQIGRRKWRAGPVPTLEGTTDPAVILDGSAGFAGKLVRVSGRARPCGNLLLLAAGKRNLVVRLPAGGPTQIGGMTLVEGKIVPSTTEATANCAEAAKAAVLLEATSAVVEAGR